MWDVYKEKIKGSKFGRFQTNKKLKNKNPIVPKYSMFYLNINFSITIDIDFLLIFEFNYLYISL